MKIRVLIILVALLCVPFTSEARKKSKKKDAKVEEKTESKYEKLFKGKQCTTVKGMITLHKMDQKVYMEFPLSLMEREMLLGATVSEISDNSNALVGQKNNPLVHIKFSLADSTVQMKEVSNERKTQMISDTKDPNVKAAMAKGNFAPVMDAYKIEAYSPDSTAVVFDVTKFFVGNNSWLQPFDPYSQRTYYGMAARFIKYQKDLSYVDEIKAFEDNISITSSLSYLQDIIYMGIVMFAHNEPVTAKVNCSLVLLPEEPSMRPRIADPRVGYFFGYKSNVSTTQDGIKDIYFINRWDVQPKDVEAYKRGELVEPVKPIVFYVDDAFPELWKEPIRQAVTTWNIAFEKIGFKNVMVAKDFPKDDPDFDPDNLKYSCIRYVPNSTANAMGPSWTDPTTGEIINASVLVYGNIIQLINNWRFVQTAQLDPSVRTKKLPDDVVQASLIYVVAHEVGHCLGFMHNMASSAAFPVDSLRSATFTQKYGTTPCIMDYARFNYVAQPGDKGVKLTPPNLGVYDEFLIKWNYRYVPDARDEWDEQAIVEKWVDEKAGDPIYRYGRQQIQVRYDPSAIEEDLGDDPVKASDYGVKNLKYILSNLKGWINDDADYSHRQTLYGQIMNQYYRYLRNVMYNVGGIYLTEVKEGTPGKRYEAVPKARQKASLAWVLKQFKDSDWLNNAELKQHFPLHVDGSAIVRDRVAKDLRGLTSNVILSSHVANSPYTVNEFMTDLYNGTWNNLLQGRSLTQGDKILQQAMVDMFCESLSDGAGKKSASPFGFAPSVDEIVAYGLDESGLIGRFAEQFRAVDEEYGRGYVASRMIENRFGTPGYGWQRAVNVSAIDDSKAYMQDMAIKSRNLLKSKLGGTSGSAKVHYQSLLIKLNNALKDKL